MIRLTAKIFFQSFYLLFIENGDQSVEVFFQPLFNLWIGITVNAANDVYRIAQSQVAKRRSVIFGIIERGPFCPAGMKQIVIDPVSLLGMHRLPYLSAAVKTLVRQ